MYYFRNYITTIWIFFNVIIPDQINLDLSLTAQTSNFIDSGAHEMLRQHSL